MVVLQWAPVEIRSHFGEHLPHMEKHPHTTTGSMVTHPRPSTKHTQRAFKPLPLEETLHMKKRWWRQSHTYPQTIFVHRKVLSLDALEHNPDTDHTILHYLRHLVCAILFLRLCISAKPFVLWRWFWDNALIVYVKAFQCVLVQGPVSNNNWLSSLFLFLPWRYLVQMDNFDTNRKVSLF